MNINWPELMDKPVVFEDGTRVLTAYTKTWYASGMITEFWHWDGGCTQTEPKLVPKEPWRR